MGKARAYRCSQCTQVNVKHRMEAHYYKHHVSLVRSPFYCSLCLFRCSTQKQLDDHVEKYKPHVDRAKGKKESRACLRKAENPYYISSSDIIKLSADETEAWRRGHQMEVTPNLEKAAVDTLALAASEISVPIRAEASFLDNLSEEWLDEFGSLFQTPGLSLEARPMEPAMQVAVVEGCEVGQQVPDGPMAGVEEYDPMRPQMNVLPNSISQEVQTYSPPSKDVAIQVTTPCEQCIVRELELVEEINTLKDDVGAIKSTVQSMEAQMDITNQMLTSFQQSHDAIIAILSQIQSGGRSQGALLYVPLPSPPRPPRH